MASYPYLQFYAGDWLADSQVRACSPATRGIWIDLLCVMHQRDRSGEVRGTLAQLARMAAVTESEMAEALLELAQTGAAEVEEGENDLAPARQLVTVRNRRMSRERHARELAAKRQQKQRGKEQPVKASRPRHAEVTHPVTDESRGIYQIPDNPPLSPLPAEKRNGAAAAAPGGGDERASVEVEADRIDDYRNHGRRSVAAEVAARREARRDQAREARLGRTNTGTAVTDELRAFLAENQPR